jgi:voltage-gated potassium channel
MRALLAQVFEFRNQDNQLAHTYGYIMSVIIIVSLLPLCFRESGALLDAVDIVCTIIFIADYLGRWITADLKLKHGALSFLIYPFTPMALIDLLSILPGIALINPAFKLMRLVRLVRLIRVFKLLRYSTSFVIIAKVFHDERKPLLTVLAMVCVYTLMAALLIFNVEPETFPSLFDAVYWAVISLTTVGYGDLYPTTEIGRLVAMVSSLVGTAVVALPSAIVTAGYLEELNRFHGKDGKTAADEFIEESAAESVSQSALESAKESMAESASEGAKGL